VDGSGDIGQSRIALYTGEWRAKERVRGENLALAFRLLFEPAFPLSYGCICSPYLFTLLPNQVSSMNSESNDATREPPIQDPGGPSNTEGVSPIPAMAVGASLSAGPRHYHPKYGWLSDEQASYYLHYGNNFDDQPGS